ncbi:MAG: hypothetical protein GY719_32885 [bacterium]|nr:hypothetical protein [bacterium]
MLVEPLDLGEVRASFEELAVGEPVAAFVISGDRPQTSLRIGYHLWKNGEEIQDSMRAGFGSGCEPFEHLVVIVLKKVGAEQLLKVDFMYDFDRPFGDGHVWPGWKTLPYSRIVFPETQAIREPVRLSLDQDVPIWGVFNGAVPEDGDEIRATARRADSALVVHIRNDKWY